MTLFLAISQWSKKGQPGGYGASYRVKSLKAKDFSLSLWDFLLCNPEMFLNSETYRKFVCPRSTYCQIPHQALHQ